MHPFGNLEGSFRVRSRMPRAPSSTTLGGRKVARADGLLLRGETARMVGVGPGSRAATCGSRV